MELHGKWLDQTIESVSNRFKNGQLSAREFAREIWSQPDIPDGLQALPTWVLQDLVERRLEILVDAGRTKVNSARKGWRLYTVLDVLDALAGL